MHLLVFDALQHIQKLIKFERKTYICFLVSPNDVCLGIISRNTTELSYALKILNIGILLIIKKKLGLEIES